MPLAFPSHQGLILPVWAKWPERFNGLGLCVGAAAPDIVDAVAWPFRGRLGQWLGHSLVGLVFLCLPAGLLLTFLLRAVGRARAPDSSLRLLDNAGSLQHGSGIRVRGPLHRGRAGDVARLSVSVLVGAASHLLSDLFTHANLVLLLPWYERRDWFPAWFCRAWTRVPLLVYEEPYPIAPHTLAWFVLSIVGAVMYARLVKKARARA